MSDFDTFIVRFLQKKPDLVTTIEYTLNDEKMKITPLLVMSILGLAFGALGYIMSLGAVSLFGISFIYLGLSGLVLYLLLRYVLKLSLRLQVTMEVILILLFLVFGFMEYKK